MMNFYDDPFSNPLPLFDKGSGIDPNDPFNGCLITTIAMLFALFFIILLLIALFTN